MRGRLLRMFAADNEHLHHRLIYLGMSHLQSTFLLMIVAIGIGSTAIILSHLPLAGRMVALGYLFVALFLILNRLGVIGMDPWITFPRVKRLPEKIIGVIDPDDIFLHSLHSFKQRQFEFLSMPARLAKFNGEDLVAVMLYNAAAGTFGEKWNLALRASEYHDCPVMVIADSADIEKCQAQNPDGFKSIHFMSKPVHVPELIRELDRISKIHPLLVRRVRERRFSRNKIALRDNARS
jgi:hypothetical protein